MFTERITGTEYNIIRRRQRGRVYKENRVRFDVNYRVCGQRKGECLTYSLARVYVIERLKLFAVLYFLLFLLIDFDVGKTRANVWRGRAFVGRAEDTSVVRTLRGQSGDPQRRSNGTCQKVRIRISYHIRLIRIKIQVREWKFSKITHCREPWSRVTLLCQMTYGRVVPYNSF